MMLTSGAFGYLADYVLWWVLFGSILVHTWCFFRCFPRQKWRKTGLFLGNALVFLCFLGVLGLAGETYYRFLAVETDAFGMSLPARRWFALHTRLNSLGCRDEEWPVEKRPGTHRIAFVGDSFAYGWGIEREEDRFTELVEARLNAETHEGLNAARVEVMNVAKPGWDTGAQIGPVRHLIEAYDVDEVVLCYVPNDIEKLLPRSAEFDPIVPPQPVLFNPDSSYLLDHLYRRFFVARAPTVANYFDWLAEGFADESIWREHQRQLFAIIEPCRSNEVTLRVVLLPFLRTTGEKYDAERLHAMLAGFFRSNGVPVLDLLAVTAGLEVKELVVNAYDAHPNERAHALFAEAILEGFYPRRR